MLQMPIPSQPTALLTRPVQGANSSASDLTIISSVKTTKKKITKPKLSHKNWLVKEWF